MITIRQATRSDLADIQQVRGLVRENKLSFTLPDDRVLAGLETRGRGWVALDAEKVVGFSMADLETCSIWGLFLLPEWEGRGLGQSLLTEAVNWLREQRCSRLWLSTAPGTRAEGFYDHVGWQRAGHTETGEVRFELALNADKGVHLGSRTRNGRPN